MKKRMLIAVILICTIVIGVIEWKTRKDFAIDMAKVNDIIVEETMDNVKVKVSEDDKVHISYYEGLSHYYIISEEYGTLTIRGNNRVPIVLDLQNPSLTIKVPVGYGKSIEINTEKKCSIDESIKWSSVQVNSEND